MTLDFSCRHLDEATVLELHGRLVGANADRLERSLALLLSRLRRPLVIDLAAVTEHDDAGIAVLAGAARAAPSATPVRIAGIHGSLGGLVDGTAAIAGIPAFTSVAGASAGDASDLVLPL